MQYLVESHLGGYYISDLDQSDIEVYCEQCGIIKELETNKIKLLKK